MSKRPKSTPRLRTSSAACLVIALLPCAALLPAAAASVPLPVRLNDTGLTHCTRDFVHFTKDCEGTGLDADFGRDVEHPGNRDGLAGFSFRKVCNSGEFAGSGSCTGQAALGSGMNDWGCTYDRVTGLEWEVKTSDGGLRDGGRTYTDLGDDSVDDASRFAADVNAAGLCAAADWRLPNAHELTGIQDFDRHAPQPAIDANWFPNTVLAWWWSADAFAFDPPGYAWSISTDFAGDSSVDDVFAQPLTNRQAVRLVRNPGQARLAAPRFTLDGDRQEVADHLTHLVWRRCVEGMRFSDNGHCLGRYLELSIEGALSHAAQVDQKTGQAWRLPNVKELESIIDRTRYLPAVDPALFPDPPASGEWTSTTRSWLSPREGWTVNMDTGYVRTQNSRQPLPVLMVRDGD